MTIRRAPYNLQQTHSRRTADALRDLARMADDGKVIGVAVGVVMADGAHNALLAGVCEKNRALAYLLAGKLGKTILEE
ncbi:hypothetical protein [Denitromonas halophila]|uniref:Uncharacterized protein n=1 Tax=Denitromonas halophila TaxID=1629404 RepID=A0A557QLQ3_9RHOO|nr:hypothetical protein [Denitromonas halophila]TVO53830.1 hypothetical protein FHP91_13615 [Denitromonas halophila]